MEGINWENVLKELQREAEKADPHSKARGKKMASKWAYSRLSYRQRKELQEC